MSARRTATGTLGDSPSGQGRLGAGAGSPPAPAVAWPARGRPALRSPRRRGERGYITLFILSLAAAAFLAVAGALQTNRCLQEWNRRHAQQLQARAAEIAIQP